MTEPGPMVEVFSSGGGTQSTAIAALIVQGRLPKPDVVAIADTGFEKSTTWAYLDEVVRPALAALGLSVHRVGPEWATQPPHGNRFASHNGNTVLIPGFSSQTEGERGKLSGYCSKTWKVEPIRRYLRVALGIPTRLQKKWIGFSLDEKKRAQRLMLSEEYRTGNIRLPLIHDVPLHRAEAIELVKQMGWPEPPRSACYLCPNMSDDEWRSITPEELAMAGVHERALQEYDPHIWLHKDMVPIETVSFKGPDDDPDDRACSAEGCFT